MISKFIKAFLGELNKHYNAYYEKADSLAKFPYIVVPTISLRPLNSGYSTLIDIEIYNNEQSETTIESIVDNLKNKLDDFVYNDSSIAFHLGFESAYLGTSNEQDLSIKKITYEVRIFNKGGN